MPENTDYSEQLANVKRYKSIVEFKDGSTQESDWYLNDIYARDFAANFFDEDNYSSYEIKEKIFKEDLSKIKPGINPAFL